MGEITLRKALDDYKTVYMPYRNFAEGTRVEYQNDLEDLLAFLVKTGINHVGEIGLPILERYIAGLEQKGLASRTRKRRVVALRSFLLFLNQDGYISTNIAKKVILPFTENSAPYILTKAECNRLRKACADNPRDKAIIELLLNTGIKLSELVKLTLDDLELEWRSAKEKAFVRIRGRRGKKERMVPLDLQTYFTLRGYRAIRKGDDNTPFFLNRFDEPLGERGVQKIVRKYLKQAGIGGASINTLRHTFGVQHIAKGTNLKTVQGIMGLKDVRSTTTYQSMAKEVVSRELEEHAL
jgi:integrase/recombinase XerD